MPLSLHQWTPGKPREAACCTCAQVHSIETAAALGQLPQPAVTALRCHIAGPTRSLRTSYSSDLRTVQEPSALKCLGGGEALPQASKRMKLSGMNMASEGVQHKVRQTSRYCVWQHS